MRIYFLLILLAAHYQQGTAQNVGIGTTTPSEKLQVEGNIKANGLKLPTGASNAAVLTSDNAGTATWKKKSFFKVAGFSDTIQVPGSSTTRVIEKWAQIEINSANAFFNFINGEYYVTTPGIYRITTKFHCSFSANAGWYCVGVMVNGTSRSESWRGANNGYNLVEGNYLLQLNAQDKVKIFVHNVNAPTAGIGSLYTANTGPKYNDFTIEQLE